MRNQFKNALPTWPTVPPRLWLTAAGMGLAGLSLWFKQEIWPTSPHAGLWAWVAITLLVGVAGWQAVRVLLAWPFTYDGPHWLRFLIGCVALAAGIGIAIITLLLSVLSGLRVVWLVAG